MSALDDHGGSTVSEVEEENKQDMEVESKAAEDKGKTRNGEIDGESTVDAVKEGPEEKVVPKQQELPPKIRYFTEPNQEYASDAFKIFFFHMIPFTIIPHVICLMFLYWSYKRHGAYAFMYFFTIFAVLALFPNVYSPTYRRAVRETFYRLFARYVPKAQYIVPDKPFPEDKSYIFACHPHGRMFYSGILFTQLHETWREGILKNGDIFMGAAGGFFYIPILNLLFSLAGTVPVTKSNIVAKLREGSHMTILIGGIKEVLMGTEDHVDRIYLKKRKGFIKIAIEENAGVVPVYFFNENQMFNHNSKSFLKIFEHINKYYYRLGVPFFRGRYNLPMPFRRPLLMAIGEPLFAKEGENVDSFHQRYMQALRELFDKYVPYSPHPDTQLDIQ